MDTKRFDRYVRPPAYDHQPPGEADAPQSWAMLDKRGYFADRRNATTASCEMGNGVEIQVTFCAAPPPLVSYFCVWCPSEEHPADQIPTEPKILGLEADLVALAVGRASPNFFSDPTNLDVLIYQAAAGGRKRPTLRRIARPVPYFHLHFSTGFLPNSNAEDDDSYHLVTLHPNLDSAWEYTLHVYSSTTEDWVSKPVSLHKKHHHSQFVCNPTQAITLGEGGLMGFVDLCRGIIICDVLAASTVPMKYIQFPKQLKIQRKDRSNAVLARHVVVVDGRIKVADCFRRNSDPRIKYNGWRVSIWSKKDTSLDDNWHRDCIVQIGDISVDSSSLHLELLPELKDLDGKLDLDRFYIAYPTISLNDDGLLYFLAMVNPWDKSAWVLAVDTKSMKLKDVGVFRIERHLGIVSNYLFTRISTYFSSGQGVKGDLKRPGNFVLEYPHKKLSAIMDDAVYDPMQQDSGSNAATHEEGERMALD